METMYIGSTPPEEDCEQLGPNYNPSRAKAECRAYINQIRREFGEEPEGARLSVTSNLHDFGTYYEVVCKYDPDIEEAVEYAFKVEVTSNSWDDEARRELGS